jgi:aspartyl aminopeptidase
MEPIQDLASFIDASPTPFHAAHNAAARLADAGFDLFDPAQSDQPGARFTIRDGAVVAWLDGSRPFGPMRMIGAHTDSPNLRIRPRPDTGAAGFRQLSVEVYGGALVNSWLDRDLGLAGRVAVRTAGGSIEPVLFRTEDPVMRVPQLAIHLDREVNERGLQLDRQQHLSPVWGLGDPVEGDFRRWLAELVGASADDVFGWDASCFDHQPSAVVGADRALLAAARLDDLCCCFGAIEALIAARWAGTGPVAVLLLDHEEVGSTSATGADSAWVTGVLERRAAALGADRSTAIGQFHATTLLSADMAHATHPNYVHRHEPNHWILPGGGPVVKHNVNQRYATTSMGAAAFRSACERAGVPVQEYSHRGDMPCGSTIGPLAAARLGVEVVDVGVPQLSMHSARELVAAEDVGHMVRAFSSWFGAGS